MKLKLYYLVVFVLLISSCSQDKLETDSSFSDKQHLGNVVDEKMKYKSAVIIKAIEENQDLTNLVKQLKYNEIADSSLSVSIKSVGVNKEKNSAYLTLKDNNLYFNKDIINSNIKKFEDIITLSISNGFESTELEVLVIYGNTSQSSVEYYIPNDAETYSNTKSDISRGKTFLGIGYDVLKGGYINRDDAKMTRPILDIDKLNAANAIYQNSSSRSTWDSSNGESIISVFEKRNSKLGTNASFAKVLFSGKANAEFKTTYNGTKTIRYAKGLGLHYVTDEFLQTSDPYTLRNYLTDDFINSIANLSASSIIDHFGSHLFVRCYQGGLAEFSYSYTGHLIETEQDMNMSVSATYGFMSGSASANYYQKVNDLRNNSSLSIQVKGGNNVSFVTEDQFKRGYNTWVNSIKNNPDLCGIGNFDQCLIPIWDIVNVLNPGKANAIKQEFENRVEDQKRYLANFAMFITNINVWDMESDQTPTGYTDLVKTDMYNSAKGIVLDANHRAKGAYLRIGYALKQKPVNHDAIAEIAILGGGEYPYVPDGWTIINIDLNKKSGGWWLWLAYRRANRYDTKVIDFIGSSDTEDEPSNILIDSNWSWVNFYGTNERADLNEGIRKSNWIFLTVHKTDFKW